MKFLSNVEFGSSHLTMSLSCIPGEIMDCFLVHPFVSPQFRFGRSRIFFLPSVNLLILRVLLLHLLFLQDGI